MTQEKYENPALFLSRLTEAVQKYTNLDISTPARLLYLHIQFISPSAPDICQKLCQLEKGPKIPQQDLEIAFKFSTIGRKKWKKKKKGQICFIRCSYPRKKLNPFGPSTLAHPYGS